MHTRRRGARERVQERVRRNVMAVAAAGLSRVRVEDEAHDGGHVVIDGRKAVNMGSCAYLGLNVDPRIKAAATDAIERFGPVYSSSTAYTSIGLYTQLEEYLESIMGCRVLIPTTTTLGHLSFFQVIPTPGDVILVDAHAHASIHLALNLPRNGGLSVSTLPHNDEAALERAIVQAERAEAERIWYVADGVYSMYGDVLPTRAAKRLLDAHPTLHIYIDDAHGFGWHGRNGRGVALEEVGLHERMVVAASLSKSFGSGGAAIAVPDPELAETIQLTGGTMIFSGPLHPAELGAAVASGEIHLSPELDTLQAELNRQIALTASLLTEARLPVLGDIRTPIWFVPVGPTHGAIALGSQLLDAGFYTNVAAFPAVPHGGAGLRFTQTLYHSDGDLLNFVESLAEAWGAVTRGGDTVDLTRTMS